MKQLLTLIALAAILWVGFSILNQQIRPPSVRGIESAPDLVIDGQRVTEVFAFSNAKVLDGDSLRLSIKDQPEIELRLASIDAPEWRQSFGTEAKQHLQHLLGDREIVAWRIGQDRYERQLVYLFIEQPDRQLFEINAQMIRDGFAWHFKEYSSNPVLDSLEFGARDARLGLWSDSVAPVPPWEFRKQ